MWPWPHRSVTEFSAEIESHLALETDRLISQGMSPDEARLAARRAFGNVLGAEERFYESGRRLWLDRIAQHLRHAWKGLRARPGFVAAAVGSLTLGIGLNTAVFTLLYSVALRPLQLPRPDRLVNIYQTFGGRFSRRVEGNIHYLAYREYLAYRSRTQAFAGLSGYAESDLAVGGGQGREVHGVLTTCDYLATLGVQTVVGRGFVSDECAQAGGGAVAVLSDGYWRRELGGDRSVVGTTIVLNQQPFTVIGVAEPGFTGIDWQPADLWVPLTMQPLLTHGRDSSLTTETSWLTVIGRLKDGASARQAETELAAIARESDERHSGRRTTVEVTRATIANSPEVRSRGALIAFGTLAMTGLVLLMACANVMNLLLARALSRQREVALRLALGASRGLLIEQFLVESLVLALLGAGAGLGLAFAVPGLFHRLVPGAGSAVSLSPDLRVLAFTATVSLVAALAFGLSPAIQATGLELSSVLRTGGGGGSRRMARWRRFLVGLQLAGSAMLLALAALFGRAMSAAQSVDPGFVTSGVVSIALNTRELGYDAARTRTVYDGVIRRLNATPGIRQVAVAEHLPFLSRHTTSVLPEPGSDDAATATPAEANVVSAGYFETMAIGIVRGKAFTDLEAANGPQTPAMISLAMARTLWGDVDPVGRQFRSDGRTYLVRGVAADVRSGSLAQLDGPVFYAAPPNGDLSGLVIVIRTAVGSGPIARAIPALVHDIDPDLSPRIERFEDRIQVVLAPARLAGGLAGLFGALALALATFGVYGVVSYGVTQRWREFGIRLALGASRGQILAAVTGQGTRVALLGIGTGLGLACGVALLLRGLLLGTSPLNPVPFLAVGILMFSVALAAALIPARRAARLDPAVTLREE